ncbi:hypothetical protein [Cellulomonas shaoxiangyii]|uniref:Uncharacterized protein n=1 Tax=Cellulomonas shaoxiangyii TaxID=2566013 RepID=A0A4P7SHM6_9CELL|nr:hypothetical protein [Cellulomonas shaoxiangyii]QCB93532.1 hypothetical protein E5225_08115 [Cellulomonas shaoxiangyii]TGY86854.1 hypothetical protein E5226_00435 [Cellulomonas shaoxiangyii]
MSEDAIFSLRELKLTAVQQRGLEETVAASVAVNVYRQLEDLRASNSGCNIIGNCSSSSSKLVGETVER